MLIKNKTNKLICKIKINFTIILLLHERYELVTFSSAGYQPYRKAKQGKTARKQSCQGNARAICLVSYQKQEKRHYAACGYTVRSLRDQILQETA